MHFFCTNSCLNKGVPLSSDIEINTCIRLNIANNIDIYMTLTELIMIFFSKNIIYNCRHYSYFSIPSVAKK